MAIPKESEKGMHGASKLAGAVAETANRAQSGARQAAAETSSRANELSAAAGDRLKSAADTIRERAPRDGMWGTAATAVADRLEGAGMYLQEENLAAIAEDVGSIIRRYPVQSLLVGATIGFLLGRIRR